MPKRRTGPGAPPLQAHVAELRALAHPLRLRLIELFGEQPRTTKQVADLLGQPPTRLYHHVAALERAGLLVLEKTRKNRGTIEKWFTTPSRAIGAAPAPGKRRGSASTRDRRAAAITIFEQSKQELLEAMAEPDSAMLARVVVRSPADKQKAVRERLLAFIDELQREFECDDATTTTDHIDRWSLTMAFAPVKSKV